MSRRIRIENQTVFTVIDNETERVVSGPVGNFAHAQAVAAQSAQSEDAVLEYPTYTLHSLQVQILAMFPGAEVGEDNDGQVVIYTGLTVLDADNACEVSVLVPMPGD